MKSYYRISITAKQNGYLVDASYKIASKDSYDGCRIKDDEFIFTTWDEVQQFIKDNALVVPPVDVTTETPIN